MVYSILSDNEYKKVKPYQAISKIYNHMMNHVEYGKWAHYIEFIISKYNLPVSPILEIGCGTGQFANYFSYPVIGIDRYREMLEEAKKNNPEMNVLVEKMPSLQSIRQQTFSGVLVLYDSINYLRIPEEWFLFFQRILTILQKNGWLLFDVVTHYCCREYFLNDTIEEKFGDRSYKRIIMYDEGNRIQHNFFYVTTPEGKFFEHHQQFVPDLKWIYQQLKKAGFKHVTMFHEFTLKKPKKHSLRVHFLARKSNAD